MLQICHSKLESILEHFGDECGSIFKVMFDVFLEAYSEDVIYSAIVNWWVANEGERDRDVIAESQKP